MEFARGCQAFTAAAKVPPPYLLDTNALIDIGERYYPQDIFGNLWALFLPAMASGDVRMTRGTLNELHRGPADQWRTDVRTACLPHVVDEASGAVQGVFGRLAASVATDNLTRKLSQIDLLVLACGEAHTYPIVTADTRMRNACLRGHANAVPMFVAEMFREFGWVFPP
jgi:hypothetical protein